MCILNIACAIRKMTINELKDVAVKNYYKRMGYSKENRYY